MTVFQRLVLRGLIVVIRGIMLGNGVVRAKDWGHFATMYLNDVRRELDESP